MYRSIMCQTLKCYIDKQEAKYNSFFGVHNPKCSFPSVLSQKDKPPDMQYNNGIKLFDFFTGALSFVKQ